MDFKLNLPEKVSISQKAKGKHQKRSLKSGLWIDYTKLFSYSLTKICSLRKQAAYFCKGRCRIIWLIFAYKILRNTARSARLRTVMYAPSRFTCLTRIFLRQAEKSYEIRRVLLGYVPVRSLATHWSFLHFSRQFAGKISVKINHPL